MRTDHKWLEHPGKEVLKTRNTRFIAEDKTVQLIRCILDQSVLNLQRQQNKSAIHVTDCQ